MKKRTLEGKRLHHIELSDKNRTVRWVIVIVLLVIAAVSITIGLTKGLTTPDGWQTVSGNATGLNCGSDFVLQYEYGAGEASATAESKKLEPLYGKTVEDAWKLFYNEAGATDLNGLYAINQQPNGEVEVHEGLYLALQQVVVSGSRALYLAPVYAEYNRVLYSESESDAREEDPGQNEDQKAYVQKFADFAADPQAIQLVLKGNNRVLLQVSQEYLAFAQQHEVQYLVDFGWLRNAFIADYIASVLTENGLTNGFIASLDGFTRNLDTRGNSYSLNLFNKRDNSVDMAAVMEYSSPKSLISLRAYPLGSQDYGRYYSFSDGRIVTAMIDPADGQSKTAKENLVAYSAELSCGQLALSVMPVYVADTFSEDALNALTDQGIYSVWFDGVRIKHNQEDLKLTAYEPYFVN